MLRKTTAVAGLSLALIASSARSEQGPVPEGVPHLDHVFVVMMENHGYSQILNNPNAPFINQFMKSANLAENYFAIGHPSLTNYLETVGGSNFGIRTDNYPDWHSTTCTPNLISHFVSTDAPPTPIICPIYGYGWDAATPAVDYTNETSGPPGTNDIDGIKSVALAKNIDGKTIADQLVDRGMTWKAYEESLPLSGADLINFSDGVYTNLTDFSTITPVLNPPLVQGDIVALYAVKHAPFAYFRNVQEGTDPRNSLKNIVDFQGARGLYADLASGHVPSYSFIVPNQCNDQHGRGNAGPFCAFDPTDNGTQAGLNPASIYYGDVAVQRIITAIKHSPTWKEGRNAIVLVWDENDYSTAPNINQVVLAVDTNYGVAGVKSTQYYTHFSLLKTVEGGFGLPCLNHACDNDVKVMSDLFKGGERPVSHDEDDDSQN